MSELQPIDTGEIPLTEDSAVSRETLSSPRPFRFIRRAGCFIALVIWFAILLLPCGFFILATQQQITISQGDLPDQYIRVWLIMEADQRGLGISSTSTHPNDNLTGNEGVCLQTTVSYFLWQGQGQNSAYCDCYRNSGTAEQPIWTLTNTSANACR